jgi:hypothetical protein
VGAICTILGMGADLLGRIGIIEKTLDKEVEFLFGKIYMDENVHDLSGKYLII